MSILNNEITTPRQARNGTRAFLCNRTGAIYTSHANGYVRRKMCPSTLSSKGHSGQYQLNPKNETKKKFTTARNVTITYTVCKRIMILEEADRLALIEKRAKSYKPRV